MTLAERICDHCTPAVQENGFGALLGATYPLRRIVSRWFGQQVEIVSGVSVTLPRGCDWTTHDQADGSVQIAFSGTPPRLTAQHSVLRVSADMTAIVLRLGAAAIEAQVSLRMFPDFTLTIPLRAHAE